MSSFRISISPNRKAAARFVTDVRRSLQEAFLRAGKGTQAKVADLLGVDRSVITRQLHGRQDIGLGRVAEIAWALGYEPAFNLIKRDDKEGCNGPPQALPRPNIAVTTMQTATVVLTPIRIESRTTVGATPRVMEVQ